MLSRRLRRRLSARRCTTRPRACRRFAWRAARCSCCLSQLRRRLLSRRLCRRLLSHRLRRRSHRLASLHSLLSSASPSSAVASASPSLSSARRCTLRPRACRRFAWRAARFSCCLRRLRRRRPSHRLRRRSRRWSPCLASLAYVPPLCAVCRSWARCSLCVLRLCAVVASASPSFSSAVVAARLARVSPTVFRGGAHPALGRRPLRSRSGRALGEACHFSPFVIYSPYLAAVKAVGAFGAPSGFVPTARWFRRPVRFFGAVCWMRLLDVCVPGSPELIRSGSGSRASGCRVFSD